MCDELVEEMESYGQWSGGRHEVRVGQEGGGLAGGGTLVLMERQWNQESGSREGDPNGGVTTAFIHSFKWG